MIYPKNKEINQIDLKLGIKSSFPNAKESIVVSYLIWKFNQEPEVIYSFEKDDKTVISDIVFSNIDAGLSKIVTNYDRDQLLDKINSTNLFTSQIESLIVAYELVWKLARISFVNSDFPFNKERTGGKRYSKKISYTANIDLLDLLVENDKSMYLNLFYQVLLGNDVKNKFEYTQFIKILTIFSENSIYKIVHEGKDIIFDNYCIYESLLHESPVSLSDDIENKGSSRILLSSIKEGLNINLQQKGQLFEFNNSISKDTIESYVIRVRNLLALNNYKISIDNNFIEKDSETKNGETPDTKNIWIQKIMYGVPGSGKSYKISKELEQLGITESNKAEYTKRVVFHPDYTNADFVGQILPKNTNGKIEYPFTPGPLTQILKKAYLDKNHNYALIIEEINRGNAAAIFGELFQLLDRLDPGEIEKASEYEYTEGWSSYCVNNDSINAYLREDYMPENAYLSQEIIKEYKENIGIRLPPNLSLFATMNTSDQNVFKLDNAFKRRWDLEMIPNEFGKKPTKAEENQMDSTVEGFGFSWEKFRHAINDVITAPENGGDTSSFADRQLGCWFVKAEKNNENQYVISKAAFANKVLEYLWDDVFNDDPSKIFKDTYKTLAQVITDINDNNFDIFSISIG